MCSLAQAFSPLQTSRLTFGICVCIGTGISVCLPHTLRVLLLFLQQRREVELGHRRLGPTASVHGSVCMCVCVCQIAWAHCLCARQCVYVCLCVSDCLGPLPLCTAVCVCVYVCVCQIAWAHCLCARQRVPVCVCVCVRRLGPTASVHGSVCMCVCACVGIRPFEPLHRGVESVDEI